MSDHVIGGVVSLLSSLGDTPHPYEKLAHHLVVIVTPPERPTWAKGMTAANIVANVCLLTAAVATCVMRKRIGTFSLGNLTNDNLLRPNACVCFALGVTGFSTLSIIQFTLALVAESTHTVLPGRAALPGIKFLFKWAGSCCFSWSSAAHHICSKWDPPWRQSMMPQGARSQIPRSVVWTINIMFTLLSIVVFTSIIAVFSAGEIYIQNASSSTIKAVEQLRALDASGRHFSLDEALKILNPLLGLATLLDQISSHVKTGAMLWFFWDCLDVVLQFVNIYLTIGQKRKLEVGPKVGVQETLRQIMTNQSNISSRTINYVHEQNVMIIISGVIFIACLILAPVLIWTYLNSSIDMVLKVDFVLKSDLFISCLVTLIGNVLMFKILLQTIRFHKSRQTPKQTSTTSDELRMRKSIFWANSQATQEQTSICLPPGILEGLETQASESSDWMEAESQENSVETAVDPPTPTSVRFFEK